MIRIETDRLILRNWEDRDREMFHELNSDDKVMEFFPFRRTRAGVGRKAQSDSGRALRMSASAFTPSN